MAAHESLSIVIPTYCRERVLLDTLRYLLAMDPPAAEIVVIDQTPSHEVETDERLTALAAKGAIRWIRLSNPSIPKAMNRGLLETRSELVLFLDDDIRPEPELIAAHLAGHATMKRTLIAGRVLQPWHEGVDFSMDQDNLFAGTRARPCLEFMGGNFSARRSELLGVGGFDENFVKVAYRFEAEFAHRFRQAGYTIFFFPKACLHHLKAYDGGTRAHGRLLTTLTPNHSVGKYYFALRTMPLYRCMAEFLWQPVRSVATRHHLRSPWWIPVSFVAELRGIVLALRLHLHGPALISSESAAKQRA